MNAAKLFALCSALAGLSASAQTPPSTHTDPTGTAAAAQTESSAVTTTTKADVKTGSWTDKVKFSGKAYLRYSYELNEAAQNANQFAIDRMYFTGEFTPVENFRFQLTLDAGDTRNSTGNQVFFAETKNAFVEANHLLGGMYLRAGIIPTVWIGYEEDIWGYRVQGPLAIDRWGYMSSADLGIGLGGDLAGKFGSYALVVVNGEGYKSIELGKRKEIQGRLTVTPFASRGGLLGGLFASVAGVYGGYDDPDLAGRTKARAIGQVGIQSTPLTLAAEYFRFIDSSAKVKHSVNTAPLANGHGISAYGVLNVGALAGVVSGLELFGRVDWLAPDVSNAANEETTIIGGVGYRFNKHVKSLVNYEAVAYGGDVGGLGTNKANDSRIRFQTEVKF